MTELKQKYGSKNCVAVVAAMAFDCPVEEFEKFAEPTPEERYRETEFVRFALTKGFFVGVVFMQPDFTNGSRTMQTTMNASDAPAFVTVLSEYEANQYHAVYWDGQKIHDPDPRAINNKLENYQVEAWYPILKINNQ